MSRPPFQDPQCLGWVLQWADTRSQCHLHCGGTVAQCLGPIPLVILSIFRTYCLTTPPTFISTAQTSFLNSRLVYEAVFSLESDRHSMSETSLLIPPSVPLSLTSRLHNSSWSSYSRQKSWSHLWASCITHISYPVPFKFLLITPSKHFHEWMLLA